MPLTNKEKIIVLISQAISLYSSRIQEGKTPPGQSVVDFILNNTPQEYRKELSIELIDDVFSFVSSDNMQLS